MADLAHPQLARASPTPPRTRCRRGSWRGTRDRPAARRGRRKPNTGQAPIIRNTMPAAKLTPPTVTIRMRKPVALSERCGVNTAENSVGSPARSLSSVMADSVYEDDGPQDDPQERASPKARSAQSRHAPAPAKSRREESQDAPSEALDRRRDRGSISPLPARAIRRRAANSSTSTPITLLVAVVLSAQATDAGVNKATPALFAAADTPEKMVALGEDERARPDQDHRPLSHQGEKRHRRCRKN